MTWTRQKDRYARLPGRAWRTAPLSGLSLAAFGLFSRAWSYMADGMSDGVLPAHELAALAKGPVPKKALEELLATVWERVEGGYRCRLYLIENISRQGWEEAKADQNERKARSRARHPTGHGSVTRDTTGDSQTQDTGRSPFRERGRDAPARSYENGEGEHERAKRRSVGLAPPVRAVVEADADLEALKAGAAE